jgi:uncharacterized protein (TIGR02145 family)
MKNNLDIGTMIPSTQEQEDNGVIEKYCHGNVEANCEVYGGLYQWDEVMQYVTVQGTQGICPAGWHIPTDAEWSTLVAYLGGSGVAGGKMKRTGTTYWAAPNTGATNSSGFTALGGARKGDMSIFSVLRIDAHFWSSNQHDEETWAAWARHLRYDGESVSNEGANPKSYGYSCRCLLD